MVRELFSFITDTSFDRPVLVNSSIDEIVCIALLQMIPVVEVKHKEKDC